MKYGDLLVVAFMEMKMQLWRAFNSLSLFLSKGSLGMLQVFIHIHNLFLFLYKTLLSERKIFIFQRFEKIVCVYLRIKISFVFLKNKKFAKLMCKKKKFVSTHLSAHFYRISLRYFFSPLKLIFKIRKIPDIRREERGTFTEILQLWKGKKNKRRSYTS